MPSRGKTRERGYGERHKAARRAWARKVAAGEVTCARCGQSIEPGEAWDLGHDDADRSLYAGPEHASCNRAAGARAARGRARSEHPAPWRSPDGQPWSRNWGGTGIYVGP